MEENRVLGQIHIKKHFENAIRQGKISHAYIINGEEGTGKLQLAINYAKALQCQDNSLESDSVTGRACGECKSCRQTDSKNQPDIKYITHEKQVISVDDIREQINDDIDIKPYSSRYKVYIIPDSEKMNIQAQNALLKTIEEPPEYAVIILITNNADTFLPTILSRCVLLNTRPVREESIYNQLKSEYDVSDYEAKVAISFANGNPGKAIKLATSEDFADLKKTVVVTVISLRKGGMDAVANDIKKAADFKKQIDEYFAIMRIWFRDILLYKASRNEEKIIFQDEYITIKEMSDIFTFEGLDIIFKSIDQAESRIKSNVNFEVTMEVLFLAIKERIQE